MAGTLVDSNVILDVLTEDPRWYAWSSSALAQCANQGPLYINPIIYAEVSIGVATIEEMDEVLKIALEEKLVALAEDTPEALAKVIPPAIPTSQPVAHQ